MSEYIMDANQWKAMLLDGLQDGTLSDRAAEWVAECALRAYEDGVSDGQVVDEIEQLERERVKKWDAGS